MEYEKAKAETIEILKKYNFNEKCLNEFKNAKQGEYCVIDEIIQLLGELHHTDEIKRFLKCPKQKRSLWDKCPKQKRSQRDYPYNSL